MRSSTRNGRFDVRRWGVRGAAVAAFVTALLAIGGLSSASAVGGPAPTATTIHAPYHGTHTTSSAAVSATGCGAGAIVQAPTFSPRSGTGGFSSTSSGTLCNNLTLVQADQALGVSVPIGTVSGSVHITLRWTIHLTATLGITPSPCRPEYSDNATASFCSVESFAFVDGYAFLYDATTGTFPVVTTSNLPALSFSDSYTKLCYGFHCTLERTGGAGSYSVAAHERATVGASGLAHGDRYFVVTDLYGFSGVVVQSSLATFGHARASASLNVATHGNGVDLVSVTIA